MTKKNPATPEPVVLEGATDDVDEEMEAYAEAEEHLDNRPGAPAHEVPAHLEEEYLELRIAEAHQKLLDGSKFDVKVGSAWKEISPHPLSLNYPVMDIDSFESLVEDIAAYGMHEGVTLVKPARVTGTVHEKVTFEVLEGRHRVAVAWVLGLPLKGSTIFDGDGDEADALVDSLNLHRRHLNAAQATLLVVERLLPIERQLAKARMLAGKSVDPTANRRQGSAAAAAARRSNGLVTARNVEKLSRIGEASETRRAILNGEITSVDKARDAMLAEIGESAPTSGPPAKKRTEPTKPRLSSANKKGVVSTSAVLDSAKTNLREAIQRAQSETKPQQRSVRKQYALLDEIGDLIVEFRDLLDARAASDQQAS